MVQMGRIHRSQGRGNQPKSGGAISPEDPAFDDRENHCYWFS